MGSPAILPTSAPRPGGSPAASQPGGAVGPGTDFPTPMDYLVWAIVIDVSWALVYMVSPWQSSRHLMARNEHVVLRAAIYACLAVALVQLVQEGLVAALESNEECL